MGTMGGLGGCVVGEAGTSFFYKNIHLRANMFLFVPLQDSTMYSCCTARQKFFFSSLFELFKFVQTLLNPIRAENVEPFYTFKANF